MARRSLFFSYCIILSIIASCLSASSAMAITTTHSIFSDEDALLALKNHLGLDQNQILFKNWSAGSSICDWIGVTCGSKHKRVISLDISDMGLTGTIVPQLGNLSFLVSLNLCGNNFNGDIPQELSQLSRLKLLNFSLNSFTGKIPSWIGSLNQLEYLYLNNNSFSGSIPSSIGNLTSLKELALFTNQLSGSIPFELFNISSLERFSFALNSLSGNLPDTMCNHLQNLQVIILWSNLLDGPLPSKWSDCSKLRYLDFSRNNFSGSIPQQFWNMKMLGKALLNENSLVGTIPKEISNLTGLRGLELGECNFGGVIPKEIENLTLLSYLSLSDNNLRGSIPKGLFNSSTMRTLYLSGNFLSGSLPSTTGFWLPNLEVFSLYSNNLSGAIPLFLSNSSTLRILDLDTNNFNGAIPHYLGDLRFLEAISLSFNKLTSGSSSLELEFLKQLYNCKYLKYLQFAENPLNGILPESIGNLSISLENFEVSGCGISGEIPASVGNLSNLIILSLHDNLLTGSLPTSIMTLGNLQAIALWNNRLSGALSCNLFGLKRLSELYLFNNLFSGAVPDCIGNGISLRKLYLNSNKFSSTIPMSLWNLKDLLELNLSSNFLNSSLPIQIGNLKVVTLLDLSMNNLSGYIPDVIGDLHNMINLSLSSNLLEGPIPESIGKILSLQSLDFSENNLSGSIPMTLDKLQYLTFFNVSHNNLVGLIPTGGPFENFTEESFIFNKALCGDKRFHVPPCPTTSHEKSWFRGFKHIFIFSFSLVASIVAVIVVVICLLSRRKKKIKNKEELLQVLANNRISFYELQQATDWYNERNLLGKGGFGAVYKGTLRDGQVVAVKVFDLQAQGAFKSFEVECEMLRNLRHRNLTQVISCCSNLDFKAIVLEFMPNGSLENWLHNSENRFLSFMERLNIMIDVASALQYLHSGYPTPVVHADLKPSNVLIDEDKVAHVSDFGIAKMLEENSFTYTNTIATFGYIAPEYGSGGLLSTNCDVYSLGILLMETFTKKRPHDEMFSEGMTLRGWVNQSIGTALIDIMDDSLVNTTDQNQHFSKMIDCVTIILNLAVDCTGEIPRERKNIGEVLATLNKIKHKL